MTSFQLKDANRTYWNIYGSLIPKSWCEEQIMNFYTDNATIRVKSGVVGFENAWAHRNSY